MRVYGTDEIRNVAVLGHGGCGKTSLVDALSFVAGTSKRHGSVKDGTALTDYTQDEIDRKYSINLALAIAEWQDTKVNLIDTPGFLDFTGDALAATWAADAAVVVVAGTAGVEVGTEKVWEYCEAQGLPRILFVSMMDKEHADFEKVFRSIKDELTTKVIPVEIPVGEGPEFKGIINLFSRKLHVYKPGTKTGEYDEADVPEEYQERVEEYSQELIETIAATDDTLLERYLAGEEIDREEAISAMHRGMARNELYPLFCGSAELTFGMRALLTKMVQLCPPPRERHSMRAERWGTGDAVDLSADDDASPVVHVFKTVSEPHVGDVSFFRIYAGRVTNGVELYNAPRGAMEKLNHLSVALGKERVEMSELHAGDIGVVAKLKDTHTNDTLSTRDKPVIVARIPFPEPVIAEAVVVKQRGEEEKLLSGLQRLHEEDPTFHHSYEAELGQTIVRGVGERHLEIVIDRLARKFGVHAELTQPKVAYRETIRGKGDGQGKHKKQTGGRGQYGECWIRIAPLARGGGFEFDNQIVGGVIPSKYIPAVEKGILEAAARGIQAGYPTVDFRVELYDGSYHDVDSNEMSFKMSGILAFRNVAPTAKPVLLEPVLEVEVWTPDDNLGDVMGDLSSRRGQILGSEPDGKMTKVRVMVPEAEMYKYSTQLHSMTHGRGTHRRKFHSYQEVPPDIAAKVVEEHKKELEAAAK